MELVSGSKESKDDKNSTTKAPETENKKEDRIQKALEIISSKEKKDQNNKAKIPDEKPDKTETPEKNEPKKDDVKLKGIESSLLERIRAKQKIKQEEALTRTTEQQQRDARIQRLPELCRILRSIFVTARKPALPMDDAIRKMKDSSRSPMSFVESEIHLGLMRELLPDWIQVHQIKQGSFLKIDKNKDINVIVQKLQNMVNKSV